MFKKFKLKNKNGYVSIEVIIIAALILSLGTYFLYKFSKFNVEIEGNANTKLEKIGDDLDELHDEYYSELNPDVNKDTPYEHIKDKEVKPQLSTEFTYKTCECGTTIIITGYKGTDTNVVIPSVIDGKPVRTIDPYAFVPKSRNANGKSSVVLTSVIIPDSVITINQYAFAYNDFKTITIPGSITTLSVHAFKENMKLKKVIDKSRFITENNKTNYFSNNPILIK